MQHSEAFPSYTKAKPMKIKTQHFQIFLLIRRPNPWRYRRSIQKTFHPIRRQYHEDIDAAFRRLSILYEGQTHEDIDAGIQKTFHPIRRPNPWRYRRSIQKTFHPIRRPNPWRYRRSIQKTFHPIRRQYHEVFKQGSFRSYYRQSSAHIYLSLSNTNYSISFSIPMRNPSVRDCRLVWRIYPE